MFLHPWFQPFFLEPPKSSFLSSIFAAFLCLIFSFFVPEKIPFSEYSYAVPRGWLHQHQRVLGLKSFWFLLVGWRFLDLGVWKVQWGIVDCCWFTVEKEMERGEGSDGGRGWSWKDGEGSIIWNQFWEIMLYLKQPRVQDTSLDFLVVGFLHCVDSEFWWSVWLFACHLVVSLSRRLGGSECYRKSHGIVREWTALSLSCLWSNPSSSSFQCLYTEI